MRAHMLNKVINQHIGHLHAVSIIYALAEALTLYVSNALPVI